MSAIIFIPLTKGYVATIDFEDFEKVRGLKWQAHQVRRRIYAVRKVYRPDGSRTNLYLHRFLTPEARAVDHIDGDGLNNRRKNLRAATTRQNAQGIQCKQPGATSKYRGVSWSAAEAKWKAYIEVNSKSINLGGFMVEEDAARAYDAAAQEHFGEFASPNFPA